MGLDLGGAFIVGIKLTKEQYTVMVDEKSCTHPEAQSHPYCPMCGKRYGVRKVEHTPDWTDGDTLGAFDVECGTDNEWVVVGKRTRKLDSQDRIIQGTWIVPTPPLVSETAIRELLAAHGIKPDVGKFGYWLSIYASY